jgi:hypothetical protein
MPIPTTARRELAGGSVLVTGSSVLEEPEVPEGQTTVTCAEALSPPVDAVTVPGAHSEIAAR